MLDDATLTLVESTEEVNSFLRWLGERRPILAVDIETTGLSLARDRIRLCQFGDGQSGWAIPYDEWRGVIRHALGSYDRPQVLQHAKFDAGFLTRDGLPFAWERTHDTMLMNFLIDSLGPKGLKPAAALYVDPQARAGEAELKQMMQQGGYTWETVPIEAPQYWAYGAMDTVLTARLAEVQWPKVQPYREAYDLELACERVLMDMELRGIAIDVPYCESQERALRSELDELMERLGDLNPNAPAQVAAYLQERGVELSATTATGQPSTTDEVLRALVPQFPIVGDVLEARYIRKLLSSYFENFLHYNANGRLNPHINQLAARTGRMSVTEPALQTIPRASLVRDAFVPSEGCSLVLADYDNQELRVAAHVSNDVAMLAALNEGRDLHGEAARRLYGDDYTKQQRSVAKSVMFAKVYGAGIDKLAQASGVPYAEAAAISALLNDMYPQLVTTMATVSSAVRARDRGDGFGWIALGDGRHLRVKSDKSYVGFNARVQGECAVVLKRSLVDLDAAGLGPFLVLPVHDEIVFDVPNDMLAAVVPELTRVMTRNEYRAPLTVSTKTVTRWGDAYE